MQGKQLGSFGEKIAENFLKKRGYKILDRNYYSKFAAGPLRGEVDIVAKRDNVISFIEVKTLLSQEAFLPEDKVDWKKQRKLVRTAESWLMKNRIPLESPWQIDVVAIITDFSRKSAKIRHFKNAIC
ncbi:MAG: putative endonuclease [Parcubacteria group bacterium Gr01-1014_30]|nr:MAG: putative endonuclease [Parcubacteria group bacterium Gr01-1014_30]